ncbi:MAG: hypothetical protein ACUVSK_05055 [Desulfotomaculales bacterium]
MTGKEIGQDFLPSGSKKVLWFFISTIIDFRGVIYALILIVTIILRPQGIFGGREWKMFVPAISIAGRDKKEAKRDGVA